MRRNCGAGATHISPNFNRKRTENAFVQSAETELRALKWRLMVGLFLGIISVDSQILERRESSYIIEIRYAKFWT